MTNPALTAPTVRRDGTMRALVSRHYGGPDVVAVEDVVKPAPQAGELLIRKHASVVTAAICAARVGKRLATRLYFGLTRPKWPILGTNFSGVVEEVGSEVTRFRVGDRVSGTSATNFGAFAEYIVVAADAAIVLTPAHLSDAEAVAVFDGAVTALPFLRDTACLHAGQSILINGASGAVGTAAIQLAKHFGATVTAVCSTTNLELVRTLGADSVIDYTTEDFTEKTDAYDVVFDTVATSSFSRSRGALKRGGIYLTTVPSPTILLQMLWTSRIGPKKAAITFTGLAKPAELAKNLSFIAELAESGEFVPVIGATHPIERAAEAHRLVDTGHKTGSAVLIIGTEQ
ncbi:NAD(P)-dependent alcohol dehydrogenase [Micromonospora sp. DT81.3]|uniref:NAD(P)-dependent alcohol dehydrogenase n=1 Tax=Micromonospora sp. DT81.3 TaxID=3416523 RepID=UPI003CF44675